MDKKERKITIFEGKQFIGLLDDLEEIGLTMNMDLPSLTKKVLADFRDEHKKDKA